MSDTVCQLGKTKAFELIDIWKRHQTLILMALSMAFGAWCAWSFVENVGNTCVEVPTRAAGWWPRVVCGDGVQRSIWTMVSAIAAAPAAATAWFIRIARRGDDVRIAQESQVTGRFVAAVELLAEPGDAKQASRVGGIYALERIAIDSPRDLETVTDTLTAFFIATASNPTRLAERTIAVQVLGRMGALNVRRRRKNLTGARLAYANLSRADLTEAKLAYANLRGANLRGADLRGAKLMEADLMEADLRHANLMRAWLHGADLMEAKLMRADLTEAKLYKAKLRGANLTNAHLEGAALMEADLRQADLSLTDLMEANLRGAYLTGASLNGSKLEGAKNLTQEQVDSAYGDSSTQLPDGITRPGAWTTATKPDSSEN